MSKSATQIGMLVWKNGSLSCSALCLCLHFPVGLTYPPPVGPRLCLASAQKTSLLLHLGDFDLTLDRKCLWIDAAVCKE